MSSSEGQLKTTKDGRPFAKAFHELFAAFLSAVKLGSHRHVFKNYSNTFTTKEAIETLSELKFTQSISQPDPKNPSTVVTTTVTTTFSMDSDMACYLLSEFLQAHLIFNVVDPQSTDVPNDGIYGLTGKGNVLYELFLRESRQELLASAKPVAGGSADDTSRKTVPPPQRKGAALAELVAPSGMLLSLEREPEDDQMVLNQQVIAELFRAFAGQTPNYEEKDKNASLSPVAPSPRDMAAGDTESQSSSSSLNMAVAPGVDEQEVTAKVSVNGVRLRDRTQVFKKVKMTFHGRVAIDWLMAHTTLVNREEAAKLADKFLANGYIRAVGDSSPEFRDVKQVVYAFTDEGQRVAGWEVGEGSKGRTLSQDMKEGIFQFGRQCVPSSGGQMGGSRRTLSMEDAGSSMKPLSEHFAVVRAMGPVPDSPESKRQSLSTLVPGSPPVQAKDADAPVISNRQRLMRVLEHRELEALFREFLKSMICGENLEIYHDVVAFKIRFGDRPLCLGGAKGPIGDDDDRPDDPEMVKAANEIFTTYLAPDAPRDVNVMHKVRREITEYMTLLGERVSLETGLPKQGPAADGVQQQQQQQQPASAPADAQGAPPATGAPASAGRCPRLSTRLFNKIEEHSFNLMAADSIPKFLKTNAFQEAVTSKLYPGLSPLKTGASKLSLSDKQAKRAPQETIPGAAPLGSVDDRRKGGGMRM